METSGSKKQEATMMKNERAVIQGALRIGLCFALGVCAVMSCSGQEKKVTQLAGVDNTRMGAYRALAQLSFQAFQKGDITTAAELARILERTWDQGEWHNTSDGSYCKANRTVCQPMDHAMDVFIGPIVGYNPVPPDRAAVESAYRSASEMLKGDGMEIYRSDADSAFQAFEKGDMAGAQTLGRKLQTDWRDGTGDLRKADPATWTATTQAIGLFVLPIQRYQPNRPEPTEVAKAYQDYLSKLAQAD